MKEQRYGIVYLGSKEKILHLIDYILHREHSKKYFIDLFAGGLSVSAYALKHSNMNVIANDLNPYVIEFYKELLNGGKNFKQIQHEWIERKLFEDVRKYPQYHPSWFVGYVLNMWSFGCNQKDYLYARDLEENKKALHYAIVFKKYELIKSIPLLKGFYEGFIKGSIFEGVDYKKNSNARIIFMEKLHDFTRSRKSNTKDYIELKRLDMQINLNLLEKTEAIYELIPLKERFTLKNQDWKYAYNEIPKNILEQAIIYCDPPYQDAKEYQFGQGFNYLEFWKWVKECPYPVYVSSYKAPEGIEAINFEKKAQLLDNGHRGDNKPKKVVNENIYWNGKGGESKTLLDILFGK